MTQSKDETENFKKRMEAVGNGFVDSFHFLALFVIGGTVVWSAVAEYIYIIKAGHPTLKDILLLFIYLEIGAMIGIYFKTRRLPVVFLIYIAITALTRVLTVDIKSMEWPMVITLSGAILILSLSVIFVSNKNPFLKKSEKTNNETKSSEII